MTTYSTALQFTTKKPKILTAAMCLWFHQWNSWRESFPSFPWSGVADLKTVAAWEGFHIGVVLTGPIPPSSSRKSPLLLLLLWGQKGREMWGQNTRESIDLGGNLRTLCSNIQLTQPISQHYFPVEQMVFRFISNCLFKLSPTLQHELSWMTWHKQADRKARSPPIPLQQEL